MNSNRKSIDSTPEPTSSARVTRSAARLQAASLGSTETSVPAAPDPQPAADTSTPAPKPGRKRKAPAQEKSPEQLETVTEPSRRRTKRTKVEDTAPPAQQLPPPFTTTRRKKAKAQADMSGVGSSNQPPEDTTSAPQVTPSASSSKRKQGRKKTGTAQEKSTMPQSNSQPSEPVPAPAPSSSRRLKKRGDEEDVDMQDVVDREIERIMKERSESTGLGDGDSRPSSTRRYLDDDDDPFGGGFGGPPGGALGLSRTLRHISGMMSGMTSRFRNLLEQLRQKDDPSVQLIALQELSELLLVSNEDNLAGHFTPDSFVKELVALMQPNDFTGEENPEMMMLACRCIANLMEALPQATPSVVYGGAVPVLCQKLLEIQYIDVAEQALSTLEKISVEFPSSIVREGGLVACLQYMDFFATSTQRTAVTTAANCCRNIPEESFPTIRDVMPILLNVLKSSDQKVVEQGCLCVCRIIESFKYRSDKLEELVSPELLRAVLQLLLPGATNLIGPNIHTYFLKVLGFVASASPRLCVELFRMNVVDTLYQILTGVSPPTGIHDAATKIDSVVIMQALIHRPRDQIFETLNLICQLLPEIDADDLHFFDELLDAGYPTDDYIPMSKPKKEKDKRAKLLEGCKDELRRFAAILFPTLTDAYSSTVNLSVRQKVLKAQLQMLSNFDTDILEDALRTVPYSSYLASILSQHDHLSLVTYSLQAAELLLKRLESIYRYQFYREGVIAEISKLAERPLKTLEEKARMQKPVPGPASQGTETTSDGIDIEILEDVHEDTYRSEDDDEDNHEENEENENENEDERSESESDDQSDHPYIPPVMPDFQDLITLQAKKFIEVHEGGLDSKNIRAKADKILDNLTTLAQDIRSSCFGRDEEDGLELFSRLADHFDTDTLESITSYELLTSGIVAVLLDIFSDQNAGSAEARSKFIQAFMTQKDHKVTATGNPATAFSILVSKLHDLLSRAEHFEVLTVHHNAFESNRGSAASMLAKQLRLKLLADEDSGIPHSFSNIQVSIHAIATFRSLEEYLRPKIALGDPLFGGGRSSAAMQRAMAAYAAAMAQRRAVDGRSPLPPAVPAPSDLTNMTIPKRAERIKTKQSASTDPAAQSATTPKVDPKETSSSSRQPEQSSTRRSSRRQKSQAQAQPTPPPPPPARTPTLGNDETLECADEAPLSDEDPMASEEALNALVEDLEDEMNEQDDEPDPTAVNMEVASTGKVTARTEDGRRVATPVSGSSAGTKSLKDIRERLAAAEHLLRGHTASSSRPMSYASAVQTPPDWHIEFSINDQPISSETTIYRAVHFNQAQPNDISSRNIWGATHTIKIKKVAGPPPPAIAASLSPQPDAQTSPDSGMPLSLDKNPSTSSILRLLSILHQLNSNIDEILLDNKATTKLIHEPLSQFVNTKLTAKLNRQLEEPLIVASNCLPSWSEDLARLYPFLFPFETRHLFLQSTSFGYSRSMNRWQSAQQTNDSRHDRHRDERPFLGRLQRQKVRISRARILESAMKVMELYGSSPAILEVEYFEEVGTGLGPTLEFYSTVSKEFSKKKTKLWRENESNITDEYAFGKNGLFPAPMSEDMAQNENGTRILNLFKMLGKFIARSMLDSRIIDITFNPAFFRVCDAATALKPGLAAIRGVDSGLADSLKYFKRFADAKKFIDEDSDMTAAQKVRAIQDLNIDGVKVEDLAIDFTLPGYPQLELKAHGSQVAVTIDNVGEYIDKVVDFTLGSGVQHQIDAFRAGFSSVFPYTSLRAFTPDELVMLFGRVDEDWSLETLMDSIKADHGFNLDSKSVRNLLQVMSELTPPQRREFLQFVTGSPKLPIGGFKALTPMFTVVCKPAEAPYTSDDYLPSVMTCVNYLKMPDYTSLGVLREKLFVAIKEGQGAFHLS